MASTMMTSPQFIRDKRGKGGREGGREGGISQLVQLVCTNGLFPEHHSSRRMCFSSTALPGAGLVVDPSLSEFLVVDNVEHRNVAGLPSLSVPGAKNSVSGLRGRLVK